MMDKGKKGSNFKDNIIPVLETLLQSSLWLTGNGRDAAKLMREAIAEAYQSWHELMPEESCKFWLHKILIRQFFTGFQHSRLLVSFAVNNICAIPDKNIGLIEMTSTNIGLQSCPAGESDEDINYLQVISGLPAMCRSSMILSYLERRLNREKPNPSGIQSHAIESTLTRGRGFIRE